MIAYTVRFSYSVTTETILCLFTILTLTLLYYIRGIGKVVNHYENTPMQHTAIFTAVKMTIFS